MLLRRAQIAWCLTKARFHIWCNNKPAALRCIKQMLGESLGDVSVLSTLSSSLLNATPSAENVAQLHSDLQGVHDSARDRNRDAETYYRAAALFAGLREFHLAVAAYERRPSDRPALERRFIPTSALRMVNLPSVTRSRTEMWGQTGSSPSRQQYRAASDYIGPSLRSG